MARALIPIMFLACLALVTSLEPWFQSWQGNRAQSADLLAVLLGDARRAFANHFFIKADAYFHSGYYPSIFDNRAAFQTPHMAADAGALEEKNTGEEDDFLGPPKDWIDAFGRRFKPATHTHLDHGGAPSHTHSHGDGQPHTHGPAAKEIELGESQDVREILPGFALPPPSTRRKSRSTPPPLTGSASAWARPPKPKPSCATASAPIPTATKSSSSLAALPTSTAKTLPAPATCGNSPSPSGRSSSSEKGPRHLQPPANRLPPRLARRTRVPLGRMPALPRPLESCLPQARRNRETHHRSPAENPRRKPREAASPEPEAMKLKLLAPILALALSMAACQDKHAGHDHAKSGDGKRHPPTNTSTRPRTAARPSSSARRNFTLSSCATRRPASSSSTCWTGTWTSLSALPPPPSKSPPPSRAPADLELSARAEPRHWREGGDTSLFETQADWLKTATNFDAVVKLVDVKGKAFKDVKFNFPKGNEH